MLCDDLQFRGPKLRFHLIRWRRGQAGITAASIRNKASPLSIRTSSM